jgi:biotin carboxyl carrier protein
MKPWVKTFISVVVALAAAPLLILVFLEMREERDREAEMEKPVKEASRVSLTADRELVVRLDKEAQARAALKVEPLVPATLAPEVAAYGRFEADPSTGFTLRAPISGVLHRAPGREWPALGEDIVEGMVVGLVEPRFSSAERVDLASRLSIVKADAEARGAAVSAARSSLDRIRTLNAEEKGASDRALQEAEVRVREEEARLKSATDTVRILEASLAPGTGEANASSLTIPQAGQVVEVLARPGEAVDGGQEILRIARFDRLIARAVVPAGERLEGSPSAARILAIGREDRPLQGTPIGRAGSGRASVVGENLLFLVEVAGLPIRPGMAFQAWIPAPGAPQEGVVVPRSSFVRFGGRTWAYVQVAESGFVRRELVDAKPVENGWFVRRDFGDRQPVVTSGAQVLLSEELKSEIQVGEEEMRKG